ncbi:MAG: nucleotidyltransferase family protein [Chitinophagaceae bacterium]
MEEQQQPYEVIILAGGLGTRLRSVVAQLPKCMAPIREVPFLAYQINYLLNQEITRFVFALGYMHEAVTAYLNDAFPQINKVYVVEDKPLGTGGAIANALQLCISKNVLIVNGDTFFAFSAQELWQTHQNYNAVCTLALKPMKNFNRYGVVELNDQNKVNAFYEKKPYQQGLINGGVYLLNAVFFRQQTFSSVFSFEKDFLEQYFQSHFIAGCVQDGYFIDIGIPEDFQKAQTELPSL